MRGIAPGYSAHAQAILVQMQHVHLHGRRDVVAAYRLIAGLKGERSLMVKPLEIAHLGLVLGEASAHDQSACVSFTLLFDP